jgi:uncharacterized protein with ParB-like and HNH nuclease domain
MPGIKFDFVSLGIGELLKKSRMEVPPNQRSYAWEERHIQNLLTDLNEAISASPLKGGKNGPQRTSSATQAQKAGYV